MFDAMINILDREERDASVLVEGSQHPPQANAQRELKKVKFNEFWGVPNRVAIEDGLKTWPCASH